MTVITAATDAPIALPGRRGNERASKLTEVLVLTQRNLLKLIRVPQLAFFSLVQPILFLTLFSQVFQGLAKTPGIERLHVNYIDYLLPAILIVTVAQRRGAVGRGHRHRPQHRRDRPLPLAPDQSRFRAGGPLDVGRAALDGAGPDHGGARHGGVRLPLQGQLARRGRHDRPRRPVRVVAHVDLPGPRRRHQERRAAQVAGFMFLFPLMFAASAFVPVASLPGWMQAVAKVNPLSYLTDANRALALGWPAGTAVLKALLAIAIVTTIGVTLTTFAWKRLSKA